MKRILVYLSVALVILGLVTFLFLPLLREPLAITGYDGPVATFNDVESSTIPQVDIDSGMWIKTVTPTRISIYPVSWDIGDVLTPCGLRAEIQSVPNVLSQEVIDTVSKSVIDEVAETNTTTTVEIVKAKCNMGIAIATYEGGLATIRDVTFWIELQDNADSIFSSADDRFAYFVDIYLRDTAEEQGSMTVHPSAEGAGFDTDPITEEEVPQWLIDAGYQTSGSKMTHIRFPLEVLTAVPILIPGIPPVREESNTEWDIGFDVILTAKWVHVADYKDFNFPDLPDFWGTLLDAIAQFVWYIAGISVSIVVIAKVKDPRYIALLLGLTWMLVFWQTGVFTDILGALGV